MKVVVRRNGSATMVFSVDGVETDKRDNVDTWVRRATAFVSKDRENRLMLSMQGWAQGEDGTWSMSMSVTDRVGDVRLGDMFKTHRGGLKQLLKGGGITVETPDDDP